MQYGEYILMVLKKVHLMHQLYHQQVKYMKHLHNIHLVIKVKVHWVHLHGMASCIKFSKLRLR
jgi:hypothetical protein